MIEARTATPARSVLYLGRSRDWSGRRPGHVRLDGGSAVMAQGGTLRISDAAKALGIQRTNLYRKMRSLRVNREKR